MISIPRAWPLVLAVVSISLACPAAEEDDATATANDSGSNDATATADETAADDSAVLGCAANIEYDTTDGATESVMQTWGAACTTDQECKDLIGDPDAVCDFMAVVYELPGGYCSKPCVLPPGASSVVADAADCNPDGGVACIGVSGQFERCAIICTDDMQCSRPGYECRQMPLIAMAGDPSLCLMPECCQGSCASE
ncbi:hypothetical protein [Paraliomyxa miuraensis]|uniref:hypothetical protein n=1 Tax=Paraliomyxa miuraensis TaxID=376150 RepID=UPI00224CDB5E|nr:hypothetical protein [Paraliomyxa miuraensis]MCX4247109.1 hypothetical protein [Paraliomyxa miuraensis]